MEQNSAPNQRAQNRINTQSILAQIETDAQDSFNMLMNMILMRVRLDAREVPRESRHDLIEFWFESMVEPKIESWVHNLKVNQQQNAQALGGKEALQDFINRIRAQGPMLRAKFGDYLLRGCDHPTPTVEEAVEDFKELQQQARNT